MKTRVIAAALTLTCALPLAAEPLKTWHGGISYADARFTPDGGLNENVNNLNFKLGKYRSPLSSWEVHFGTDVASTSTDDGVEGATYVAAVMRRDIELKQTRIYGMLGLAAGMADYGNNFDDAFGGVAAGLGIELFGSPQTALTGEYMFYGATDHYQAIGVGLTHYFEWADLKP